MMRYETISLWETTILRSICRKNPEYVRTTFLNHLNGLELKFKDLLQRCIHLKDISKDHTDTDSNKYLNVLIQNITVQLTVNKVFEDSLVETKSKKMWQWIQKYFPNSNEYLDCYTKTFEYLNKKLSV